MNRLAFVTALAGVLSLTSAAHADDATPPVQPSAFVGKFETGAFGREIFSLPVLGPELSLAIGKANNAERSGSTEIFGCARYAFGETPHDLVAHTLRLGATIDFRFGRVRPFIDANLLWLAFARASESGLVQHWGIGLGGGATVDLFRLSTTGAVYLGPRIAADIFPHALIPRTFSPNAALVVGIRL
jgi:hypothetical protein